MATFKEKALEALGNAEQEELGAAKKVIRDCMYLIEAIPEEQRSDEKTCRPDYEAECKHLQSKIARLEGFREGVMFEAEVLRGCCNRMEDM